jgi:YegS/Rv2252/BmrU family lipid kinase
MHWELKSNQGMHKKSTREEPGGHAMGERYVILNPRAGRGRASVARQALEEALHKAGLAFELALTTERGEASRLAMQAIERGSNQLIAVGGDGTFHEVVNGIARSHEQHNSSTTLGIVAVGTGNDFIKSLRPTAPTTPPHSDVAAAVQRIAEGSTRAIDMGKVTITTDNSEPRTFSRYFLNDLGLGIYARVAAETFKIKRLKGRMVYALAILRALATCRSTHMQLRFDGHELAQPFLLVSFGNGQYQGAAFRFTPDALLDDGLLDLCMVDATHPGEIIRSMPLALKGTHTHRPQVTMARTTRAEVECTRPGIVSSDGEILTTEARHIVVEVVPQALTIIE